MSGVGRSYRVISCDLFTGRNLRLSRQVFHQNRKQFYCQCEKKQQAAVVRSLWLLVEKKY